MLSDRGDDTVLFPLPTDDVVVEPALAKELFRRIDDEGRGGVAGNHDSNGEDETRLGEPATDEDTEERGGELERFGVGIGCDDLTILW